MSSLAGAQGLRRWPSPTSFFQRGTTPNEIWYALGRQNQFAFDTTAYSATVFRAFPFVVSRTVKLDRLAFEVTTAAGSAVGRVGIYRATSLTNLMGSVLVVDGGEQDCSSNGIKSATVDVTLPPGAYLYCHLGGVATVTLRTAPIGSRQPVFGIQNTLTSGANSVEVGLAYQALPATFPATATALGFYSAAVVAARFVS